MAKLKPGDAVREAAQLLGEELGRLRDLVAHIDAITDENMKLQVKVESLEAEVARLKARNEQLEPTTELRKGAS